METYLLYLTIGVSVIVVLSVIQRIREKSNSVKLAACDTKLANSLETSKDSSSAVKLSRDVLEEQIKLLIAQRKKIEAIKLLRKQADIGLKAAKDAIDAVEKSGGLVIPGSEATGASDIAELDSRSPGSDLEKVKQLIRAGKKIDAVKLVRERTGLGLEEAKSEVDRLARLI